MKYEWIFSTTVSFINRKLGCTNKIGSCIVFNRFKSLENYHHIGLIDNIKLWIVAQSLQFYSRTSEITRNGHSGFEMKNVKWKMKKKLWLLVIGFWMVDVGAPLIQLNQSIRFGSVEYSFELFLISILSYYLLLVCRSICLWWCAFIGIVCGNAKHRLNIPFVDCELVSYRTAWKASPHIVYII